MNTFLHNTWYLIHNLEHLLFLMLIVLFLDIVRVVLKRFMGKLFPLLRSNIGKQTI